MLYNYMYLYIIAKDAYDIFVTDMRTEIETMDVKGKTKETNLLNYETIINAYNYTLHL